MNAPVIRPNGNGNGTAHKVAGLLNPAQRGPRSEATQIEQSRAVAEVQAMVTVAQARPRDITRAMVAMRQSCAMMGLAERAFFKFPRGGQSVAGESIHLAVELARCWGNVNYGIRELSRDDDARQSEMLAFAWDLETNARADTAFIVPHMRDKKGGAEALVDMRDIYENNANNGARRLREMIFRILPPWFRSEAKELCHLTLQKGTTEEPLPVRLANMVAAFGAIGVARDRIEARLGPIDKMTAVDLANLTISFKAIKTGEISAVEEFPGIVAGQVGEILNPQPQAAPPAPEAAPPAAAQVAAPGKDWSVPVEAIGQEKKLAAIFKLLDEKTETMADVDDLWEAHEAFFDKLGVNKRAETNQRFGDRKIELGQARQAAE